jgi:hypothetical protein
MDLIVLTHAAKEPSWLLPAIVFGATIVIFAVFIFATLTKRVDPARQESGRDEKEK